MLEKEVNVRIQVLRLSGVLLGSLIFALEPCAADPTPSTKTSSSSPVVGGEKFVQREVPDPGQGGIVAAWIFVPETWHFDSKVEWHYGWVENPVSIAAQAENPAGAEACFLYPTLQLIDVKGPPSLQRYVKKPKPGESSGAAIWLEPRPALQIMAIFIQKTRGNTKKFQWLGKQELPGLAKAMGVPKGSNQQGIAVKIAYEFDGKPVEEAFYGVYFLTQVPGAGPAKSFVQTNWGLMGLHSFRAPAGTLDKRMPVFAVIAHSFRLNPQWAERRRVIMAKLLEAFNQQLKAGYDKIAAANRLAHQVAANNNAFIQSIDRQVMANRQSGGGSSNDSTRSFADKESDLIRGVDTTEDPMYGTSQHSFMEQYHWTDGNNNWRNSNDPNYDPSHTESGTWQLMPVVK